MSHCLENIRIRCVCTNSGVHLHGGWCQPDENDHHSYIMLNVRYCVISTMLGDAPEIETWVWDGGACGGMCCGSGCKGRQRNRMEINSDHVRRHICLSSERTHHSPRLLWE